MSTPFRLAPLAGALLLAAAPFAMAESPMPDPVAPAVLGRPLEQIKPVRPVRQKPVAAKTERLKLVPSSNLAAPAPVALAAPLAPAAAQAVAVAQPAAAPQHAAKQALDDRVDPNMRMADDVGKGTRLATKPLPSGAYFSSRTQDMLRKYYAAHPVSDKPVGWKIGEPVPAKTVMTGVPDNVRAALPRLPPGHQYVQLGGDVVLVAVPSRMVVDGVSRAGS